MVSTFERIAGSRLGRSIRPVIGLAFILATIVPIIRRLLHPAILTDDVLRLANLVERPLRELIFWPCNEHVAFAFDLLSWTTWQAIGNDLRRAPMAYCIVSVVPWLILLVLLYRWLREGSGSKTAALVVLALVAQSPLILEIVWWYSASSFTWALVAIVVALDGAGRAARRPIQSAAIVGCASLLGPAATSLGHLALPLVGLRVLLTPGVMRRGGPLVIAAALSGNLAYHLICTLGGLQPLTNARQHNAQMAAPLEGLAYALTAPARVLLPSTLGVPAPWCATALPPWAFWLVSGLLIALLALAILRCREAPKRTLLVLGGAMIFGGYALAYGARAGLVKHGRVTEVQFLYDCARYHALPLMGMASILCAGLSSRVLIRRCDAQTGLPAILGLAVSLLMMFVHRGEIERHWSHMLRHPDQKSTLAALHETERIAREHGITRDQLERIIAPVVRPWNAILPEGYPGFPLVKLVDAPARVEHPLSDEEARQQLQEGLRRNHQVALGSGACAFRGRPPAEASRPIVPGTLSKSERVTQQTSGIYTTGTVPGALIYDFEPTADARFLILPGLKSDQQLIISYFDKLGRWRPAYFSRWMPPNPASDVDGIDLRSLSFLWGETITRIAIQFTNSGEIAMEGTPRLLR